MTSLRHLLLAALACAGCAREVVMFDGSPSDDARAVILVALMEGAVEAHAIDLDDPNASAILGEAENVELVAMSLARDLDTLRLEPGPLPVSREGTRPWPPARAIFVSEVRDGVQSGWTSRSDLPKRVGDLSLDLAPVEPCDVAPVGFDVTSFELPTKADARWGVRIDDRTALVMTELGEYFFVTPEGAQTATIAGAPNDAEAVQTLDGTIWLASRFGTWRSAPAPLAFERIAEGLPDDGFFLRMVAPSDPGAPFELFGLDHENGPVRRFDGSTWTALGSEVPSSNGDVHWLAPGRVAVAREAVADVEWIDGDESRVETIFEGSLQGLTALNAFGDYELLVGTRDGHVIVRRDGAWTELGDPLLDRLFVIEPDGDSFVVAGSGGEVARWAEGFGFCSDRIVPSHAFQFVPLAGGYLVLMSNRDSWDAQTIEERRFPTPVSWLFPR